MESIFQFFLIIHILGGGVGLLTGMLSMVFKKGDARHKFVGKIFSIAMLTAGISSLLLSVLHPSLFMFMVGIFTVYMVGTGNRYLDLRMLHHNQKPKLIDWTMTIIMFIAGVLFVGFGTFSLFKSNFFGIVLITFGVIGLIFVRHDFSNYRGKSAIVNYWLTEHLQRMVGAFIASSTAFLVVNAKYFPDFIPLIVYWLLPTAIFTPLIIKWANSYELKKPEK